MPLVAGVDLGGTAVNYTLLNDQGEFLIEGLCEHPARAQEGPAICLKQIEDGLEVAAAKAGVKAADIAVIGLDTPGPASATGVLSARGSTNFVHPDWAGFDIRAGLEPGVTVQRSRSPTGGEATARQVNREAGVHLIGQTALGEKGIDPAIERFRRGSCGNQSGSRAGSDVLGASIQQVV